MAKQTELTLKLLVDRNTKRVVYAEAKKDFVDFLFGLLQIPIGSIARLLRRSQKPTPGSLGQVLDSVQNLEAAHFHSDFHKNSILNPIVKTTPSSSGQTRNTPLLLKSFASFDEPRAVYDLYSSSSSTSRETSAPGYVKEQCLTYMVTDDLKVSPMSTISIFSIINTFGIKDIGSLQEKNVKIDFIMWWVWSW
ncbi:hypothetical protein OROMI_009315 [Orobanche minor]